MHFLSRLLTSFKFFFLFSCINDWLCSVLLFLFILMLCFFFSLYATFNEFSHALPHFFCSTLKFLYFYWFLLRFVWSCATVGAVLFREPMFFLWLSFQLNFITFPSVFFQAMFSRASHPPHQNFRGRQPKAASLTNRPSRAQSIQSEEEAYYF